MRKEQSEATYLLVLFQVVQLPINSFELAACLN